jgi:RND family efflux transporter MFP subunit
MVEAAKYRVKRVSAAVDSANINKKDAHVTSPYDGKVTAKMIDVGDLASPGTPILTLEKDGVFCVSFVVPEKHIQSIKLGQKVNITIPSMQDMKVRGTIGRIDPVADLKSRSFTVKVALPDDKKFRSGIFARIAIPVGKSGMIIIPKSAIIEKGQLKGFYLVDEKNIAHFRLLRTGIIMEDSIEVLSGIKNNDRYVASPSLDMKNGVNVEVIQ